MRIIVSGAIGRSYVGGQAWAYMHYLAGLQALGHDVYYLEDCGGESWVYNWDEQHLTTDLDYPAFHRFWRQVDLPGRQRCAGHDHLASTGALP